MDKEFSPTKNAVQWFSKQYKSWPEEVRLAHDIFTNLEPGDDMFEPVKKLFYLLWAKSEGFSSTQEWLDSE